jgi:hypothetical protein
VRTPPRFHGLPPRFSPRYHPVMSYTNDPSSRLVDHLSSTSTPYIDPLARVPWDRLNRRAFWVPEVGLSLHGRAEFMALPEDQRRMLSRYEFLHLLVTMQRFENMFSERVSRALQRSGDTLAHAKYRLHMVRENAGHGLMLMELVRGSGLQRVRRAGWAPLTRIIGRHAGVESLPLWTLVYVGEEVFNRVFRWLRKQHGGACPVIEEIVRVYLVDAARHLSHAHDVLETALNGLPPWQLRMLQPLVRRVFKEVVNSVFYPSRSVYESAGLYPGEVWAKIARDNPQRSRFIQQQVNTTLRPFKKRGLRVG